jgi:hypothetical protein
MIETALASATSLIIIATINRGQTTDKEVQNERDRIESAWFVVAMKDIILPEMKDIIR